jgi:hypothetical protein
MSQVLDVLSDEEDAFGRLLLDHIEEGAGDLLLEFDDGSTGPAMGS